MSPYRSTSRPWTALLAISLAVAACSTSTVGGNVVFSDANGGVTNYGFGDGHGSADGKASGDAGTQADAGDAGQAPDDSANPAHQLLFTQKADDFSGTCDTICALLLNQNASRTLKVQYLVGGQPQPDALIEFALEDKTSTLGTLSATNVPTDEKGFASAEIKAGTETGEFAVLVRVPGDPDVGTLKFDLHVQSKAKGPLEIRLHYVGSRSLSEFGMVKARLTQQDAPGQPACKDIDLGDTLPAATWESPPNLKWDPATGTTQPWVITWPQFAASLPQTGDPVTFTIVGVAAATTASNPLAAGCIDTGTSVHWNPQTKTIEGDSVTVTLTDIPPRLKGTYDLTTHLNLLSVLPPTVETVLETIINIVQDPVAGILGVACKLGNGKLDSLCANIFADPKNPNVKELSGFGGVIVQFLDALLLSVLPPNVKQGLAAGADVGEILTNLEIGGVMDLQAEPDSTGFLDKSHTQQDWNSVTYKWSLGQSCNPKDPACGKKTFNIEAFQQNAITGQFDLWRDPFLSEIKIGEHALNVKWGALVNFIVEKQVLPILFADPSNPGAPPVDDYGKLFKVLVGGKGCLNKDLCCENFGNQLAAKQSLLKADFLASTCEVLATLGATFLESQLTALDAKSGDPASGKGLLLGAEHCAILDSNQDQVIDHIGAKLTPCTWNMTLGLGGSPKQLKATFFATRQQ